MMKIRTTILIVSCVTFIVGFVTGDVYRHLSNERLFEVRSSGDPHAPSTIKCSDVGLMPAHDLPDSATQQLLAGLWGKGFENSFTATVNEAAAGSKYRFSLDADLGGVIEFCQLKSDSSYIGFVEKSLVSITDFKSTDKDFWVIFVFAEGERAIGISNAFGFESIDLIVSEE